MFGLRSCAIGCSFHSVAVAPSAGGRSADTGKVILSYVRKHCDLFLLAEVLADSCEIRRFTLIELGRLLGEPLVRRRGDRPGPTSRMTVNCYSSSGDRLPPIIVSQLSREGFGMTSPVETEFTLALLKSAALVGSALATLLLLALVATKKM